MNFKELGEKIGLEENDYRELLDLFLETGMQDYNRLKNAFDAGDAQQVARSAHTICGASGNMGILNIHELAKRIELAAVDNQLDAVSAEVGALKARFDEIAGMIQL
jgi:HPt (histidine-containing phosphotransfer) domain-containing protein